MKHLIQKSQIFTWLLVLFLILLFVVFIAIPVYFIPSLIYTRFIDNFNLTVINGFELFSIFSLIFMLAVIVEVVKRLIGDIWKALFIVFFVLTLSVSYISYQNTYYGAFPTQKIYAWDERINFSISCDRTYSFQPEDNIAMCELESDSDIPVNISYFIVDRQENQEFKNISIRPKDAMVSTVQKEFFIIGTGEAGLHKFYIAISFNKGPASESLTKEYDIFEKFMSIRVYTEEEIAEKQKEKLALLSVLVSVVFAAFSTGLYNLKKIWENK